MQEFSFRRTQELITIIYVCVYACSFKYQEQAVDVDCPFTNCSESDMSLVHSWKPSYSPSDDGNSF